MYAEMLGEGTIADEAKRRRYLETIVKESQRLSRLVGNVLDFSRLEQGRRSFHREPLELTALLGELLDRLAPRLSEAGLALEREIGAEPLPLASDRDALEQIVLNLLDNAVKYAADGGRLQVGLRREGEALRLWVRDFGPGVPATHRQRIFDKFHRVDTALTARQQGAGLGLSIARQLAEGLGGTLRYAPAEGGGSRFELTLPRQKEES